MSKKLVDLSKDFGSYIYNPTAIRDITCDLLRDVTDGSSMELVDPGNPFVFLHDNIVAIASAAIEHNEASCRRRYLYLATNMDELYPHMTDDDHLDRFDLPSNASWLLVISKDEILKNAVPRDVMQVRKLIIPRDTEFTVNNTTFTLQYPIEIRCLPHGGLQVVYNTDNESPIRELESNTLDWHVIQQPFDGVMLDMVVISIPTLQYKIRTFTDTVIAGSNYIRNYQFQDKFYTARVWSLRNNTWHELNTTYSESTISPDIPTAKLKVLGNTVRVQIPDIYITNGFISGDLRVDIYETLGKINTDLRQFNINTFEYAFNDIGSEIDSQYYKPFNTFAYIQALSTDIATGGRESLSFGELKNKLIHNALIGRKTPISDRQLDNALDKYGFGLYKSVDFVTDRIYYGTVDMLPSTIPQVTTPIGVLNSIITTSMGELSSLSTVKDNGKRITITPDTLYKEHQQLVNIELNKSISNMSKSPSSSIVELLNSGNYLYTPIHYVIDSYSDTLEIRPYYLDEPTIPTKKFIAVNETLLLDVSVDSYTFTKNDNGYKLRITTRSNKAYKELSNDKLTAQISFNPRGYDSMYAYSNGKIVGITKEDERIWEWDIDTNIDIDRNHDIIVNNFIISGATPSPVPMKLDCDLNIIFGVSTYTTPHYRPNEIDKVLRKSDDDLRGVMHEVLVLSLGTPMGGLWSSIRPISSTIKYAVYEEDVFLRYEEDVIKYVDSQPIYSVVNGKVIFEYAHRKGDYKLGKDGKPQLLHRKGSNKIVDGNRVVLNPREVNWRLELFLFDAKYIFGNTDTIVTYRGRVVSALIKYVTDNLASIKKQLLEKTKLYIYPKSSIGSVKVMLADSTTTTVNSECRFHVDYYLSEQGRKNSDLLDALSKVTKEVVNENLNLRTVTVSGIIDDIRARVGGDIIDVEMDALDRVGEKIYSIVDQSQRLTLGKKSIVNADGTIGMKDDISLGFYKHIIK